MTACPLSLRGPTALGLMALAALLLGFGVWAFTAQLSGAVHVPGQLVAEGRNIPVQHPDGGLVSEVLVREGERVVAGQVLLRLDGVALRSELAIVQARLGELSARIARLEAERDGLSQPAFPPALLLQAWTDSALAAELRGQADLMAARAATEMDVRAQLQQRKAQARARLAGIAAQAEALRVQLRLIEADLARQEPLLAKGLVPEGRMLDLRREQARLQGDAGELAATAASMRDQMAEFDIQLSSLVSRRRETALTELRDLWPQRLDLEERARVLAQRVARLNLLAPVGGEILGLRVTAAGAVLDPSDPALHLVPEGALRIIARVSPLHVARIALGQSAEIGFPGLAAEPTPRLVGTVTRVSADVLTDPQTGLRAYEVGIDLPPDAATRLAGQALQPGMPVDVYLQTGTRRAIVYLVEPFSRYFSVALREG